MMPPLRSFDDLDGKERGQKKTDDLRAMTTLGPRTLVYCSINAANLAFCCSNIAANLIMFCCRCTTAYLADVTANAILNEINFPYNF